MFDKYEVLIGNDEQVWSGTDLLEARGVFGVYRDLADGMMGRAAGQDVQLVATRIGFDFESQIEAEYIAEDRTTYING